MLAWHIGAVVFLFRWIFRDPKVDVRLLVLGAVLPDLIDLPLGTLIMADRFSSGEVYSHTLLAPIVVSVVILLTTRRGRRRRGLMALVVGWFFHLLIDGVWADTETFLWPLFGLDFPVGPMPYWSGLFERALSDPWRWIAEAIGVIYLANLIRGTQVLGRDNRSRFLTSGRLPDAIAETTS